MKSRSDEMKCKIRKIQVIFKVENWLWKLYLAAFWQPIWKTVKLKNLLSVDSWSQNSTTKVMLIYTIHYLHKILLGSFIHLFILAFFNNFIRVIVVGIKFLFNFRMTATQWIRLLNLVGKLVLTSDCWKQVLSAKASFC